MNAVRPLPARVLLLPNESLASLVRRTADAMGYENPRRIRALLKESGDVPAHINDIRTGPVWERLETLLRQSRPSILQATVHSYSQYLMLVAKTAQAPQWCDSKTILKYFRSAHPPVCPACLLEDEQTYERLAWSLRAVPVCLRHRCYLVDTCPNCPRNLQAARCEASICRCGFDLRRARPVPISESATYLLNRISLWFRGEALPLHSLRTCATLWWLERVAVAVKKAPVLLKQAADAFAIPPSTPTDLVPWLAAADILDDWPEKLFAFLDAFHEVTKHRTTVTGLTRSFGLLLREAKHLEDLGYALPADTLRQYLTYHYTAGHLTSKVCLFSAPEHAKLLQERPWVALTEADEILGFRKGGSASLLARGILEGTVRSARPGHRTVGLISRDSVDRLACDLETAYSVLEVSELLGLGRGRVLELVKADLLPRAVRTRGGWRVPRSSVEQLLDLIRKLPAINKPNECWLSIHQSTRQFGPTGLNLVRLLRLIETGKVRARKRHDCATFHDLVVSASDLTNARSDIHLMRDEELGYPLNRLARALCPGRPIKEVVLKKWIALGLLNASRNGRAQVVFPSEVTRFREEYCLLKEAEQLMQIHSRTLLRWISEGELTPVYGPRTAGGGGFHLLRRSDVIRLRDFVGSHHRKWRSHKSAA